MKKASNIRSKPQKKGDNHIQVLQKTPARRVFFSIYFNGRSLQLWSLTIPTKDPVAQFLVLRETDSNRRLSAYEAELLTPALSRYVRNLI